MNKPFYHVKKRTLLAVAGCVWLIAGFNVARLGVLSYIALEQLEWWHIALSAVVFCAFGMMFYKMSMKHTKRIKGYAEETRLVWNFFDLKAYIIMAVMMGGGIWLRNLGACSRCVYCGVLYGAWLCTWLSGGIVSCDNVQNAERIK